MSTFRATNGVTVAMVGDQMLTEDLDPVQRGGVLVTRVTRRLDPREVAALREYFRLEPKPWHDAKPGDVWLLSFGNGQPEVPWTLRFSTRRFENPDYQNSLSPDDPEIIDARRIWPGGADD